MEIPVVPVCMIVNENDEAISKRNFLNQYVHMMSNPK
jgi:hypothetical protein